MLRAGRDTWEDEEETSDMLRAGRDTCVSAGKAACGVGALLPKALLKNLGLYFLYSPPRPFGVSSLSFQGCRAQDHLV